MDSEKIIFGLDIAKGSTVARRDPSYAVVILQDTNLEKLRMVERYRLLQLIRDYKPEILAVDNIYELGSNRGELLRFVGMMPSGTRVVQVTGGDEPGSLEAIARRYGIAINRFDPVSEAHACALLARIGVGSVLQVFEDATRIVVTRARSPGRGGWSQNRYRRKVHGAVRAMTREIEADIKAYTESNKRSYSLRVTRGYGGYTRGEFVVEAPMEELKVRTGRFSDVQVRAKTIERDSFKFKPLGRRKRAYIIVGVDPGTTTGVAALDLGGELVYLGSSRTVGIPEIVERLSEIGKPLVVATDVNPMPHSVERVRRSFNAVAGVPPESLGIDEKIELTEGFEYANAHERDSLAAALYAFKRYKNKFSQIEQKVHAPSDLDEVKARVVRGETIDSALIDLRSGTPTRKEGAEAMVEKVESPKVKDETLLRKEEEIGALREYVSYLEEKIAKKDATIERLEEKIKTFKTEEYKKLKREKEIKIRNRKIKQLKLELKKKDDIITGLKERNRNINHMRRLEMTGRATPVKVVDSFTRESIRRTEERYGIKKGDILMIMDASGGGSATAKILAELGVRAVIAWSEMSHAAASELFTQNIPVFSPEELPPRIENGFAVVVTDDLRRAIAEWDRRAEEHRKNQKQEWLEYLVNEYQSKRKKELEKELKRPDSREC
ncbi:hypothetical protein AIOGIFDO_01256 [Candidatus Methanoperedenaceae archaeon GB37]|nr:hypothetical protein AIOGIFDO_01256 [Candidatus Methanoperedenaceae archaeon GB37]